MAHQLLIMLLCIALAEGEDYCNTNCYQEFNNDTNPTFQVCVDAQSNCGMSTFDIGMNAFIGLLTLIAVIAVVVRCCLAAKLIGGKKPAGYDDNEVTQRQSLQNGV